MTICRALAEIKLLDQRINRKIRENMYVAANKKSAKKVNNSVNKDEFITSGMSAYQSILDLIERRKKIKAAIVASNAITTVTENEVEMTVADAIERKTSICYEQSLLAELERQYNSALSKTNTENEKVKQKLDEFLLATLGKEGKSKATEDEINAISKPYTEQNELEIVDAIGVKDIITNMKDNVEKFISEIDFVLSESNTITKIEIN